MRILFVTPHPPSRIRVRSYGFLTQLKRAHDVTLVTQCVSEKEWADVERLRDQGFEVVAVQESRRQAIARTGLALLGSQPLQVAYAHSERLAQTVLRLCRERVFDIIHVEHLRGIASLDTIDLPYPLVWDAVDCISLLFKHTMTAGPSLSVRSIARIEQKRTGAYESGILKRLSYVAVTSEHDRDAMVVLKRRGASSTTGSYELSDRGISVVPNGVDLEYFHPTQVECRRYNVVFSGKMSYHANIATALYLRARVMPLIWQEQPDATLTIVGSSPPKAVQRMAEDPRVEVTGFVEDLRPYIQRAHVMLSPMVYSVGIQNKALEAMALGTPVVIAKQAADALSAQHGRDLFVAETPREFANFALRLMHDEQLYASMSRSGRAYVEQQHDWRMLTDSLSRLYEQAISAHLPAQSMLSHV